MYYYRRRILKTANREVILSLRTRVFRVAESIAEGLDQEFVRLARGATTDDEIDLQAILRTYLKQRSIAFKTRTWDVENLPRKNHQG